MTKMCENCGEVEIEDDRDVCEACVEKVMEQKVEVKEKDKREEE